MSNPNLERQPIKPWKKATALAAVALASFGVSEGIREATKSHHESWVSLHPPEFVYYKVPSSEVAYIEKDFTKFRTTWASKLPAMGAVSLNLVLEGQTRCGTWLSPDTITSDDESGLDFCFSNNTVNMTRSGINLINEMSTSQKNRLYAATDTPANYRPRVEHELIDLAIAHELGHAVQRATGAKNPPEDTRNEWQADCYAGEAYRDNHMPTSARKVLYLYQQFETPGVPDPAHGTASQRAASFEKGLAGESCVQ